MTGENAGAKSLESSNSSSTTLDGRNHAPPRVGFYTSQLQDFMPSTEHTHFRPDMIKLHTEQLVIVSKI